jgi:predicted SAM-dependent methyltransferase
MQKWIEKTENNMYRDYLDGKHESLFSFLMHLRRTVFRIVFFFQYQKMIKNYLRTNCVCRLQIGTGRNLKEDWLNSDLNPSSKKIFLDATKKIRFNNKTFDYIFSEHLIEHLEYDQADEFLRECYRVLKPGGKIRISTPNLVFLINLYKNEKTEDEKKYILWATEHLQDCKNPAVFVINNFFRSWGHKFIYDFETLSSMLSQIGFVDVSKLEVNQSFDSALCGLESHGKVIGEEFNILESLIIEASRAG